MKKKSLRPQIVAPVQRETTATTTSTGVVAVEPMNWVAYEGGYPFAGEDGQ